LPLVAMSQLVLGLFEAFFIVGNGYLVTICNSKNVVLSHPLVAMSQLPFLPPEFCQRSL
jgi:hypothetical protein